MVVLENSNAYFSIETKLLTSEGYITYKNLIGSSLFNSVLISTATKDSKFKSKISSFKIVYKLELKKLNSKVTRTILVSPDCYIIHRIKGAIKVKYLYPKDIIRGFIDDFYEVTSIQQLADNVCYIMPTCKVKKQSDCFLVVDDILVSWTDVEKGEI